MNKISELIARYCDGTLDEDGAKILAAWIVESEANKAFFKSEVRRYSQTRPMSEQANTFYNKVSAKAAITRKRRTARIVATSLSCAAALAVVAILGTRKAELTSSPLMQPTQITAAATQPAEDTIQAATQSRRTRSWRTSAESRSITLPDGTKVTLNHESSLTLADDFMGKTRTVTLDGEAWFDVAKNPAKPFRILCGDEVYKVTGTTFNICSFGSDKYSIVTLHTGSLEATVADNVFKMTPGDELRIDSESRDILKHKVAVSQTPSWLDEGRLVFNSLPLKYVAYQLSHKYGVKIRVNESLHDILYDGEIANESLQTSLRLLAITSPVHLRIVDMGDGGYYITKL